MRTYYIFSNGVLRRKENTIIFEASNGEKKFIPVENIDQIFVFGEVDFNNKFLNFIASKEICVHVFNYYGWYSGSFYPKEMNISGQLLVKQVEHYLDFNKRLFLAKSFIEAAIHNMRRNIEKREKYYEMLKEIDEIREKLKSAATIEKIMNLEAQATKIYYDFISAETNWEFEKRTLRPPENPLNALISFSNSMLYAYILKEVYLTPLNPTISYLHEPFERRFSLCLDVAEIFKPIISDRILLRTINLGIIKIDDFKKELNSVFLTEEGRKKVTEEFDQFLSSTILHKKLRKKVSYKTLIRLELYKLIKHILGDKDYSPLKVWW